MSDELNNILIIERTYKKLVVAPLPGGDLMIKIDGEHIEVFYLTADEEEQLEVYLRERREAR